MTAIAWLGLACLAGGSVFAAEYYGRADAWVWKTLVACGVLCLVSARLPAPRSRHAAVAALLVAPAAVLLSWPLCFGPLLAVFGLVLLGFFPRLLHRVGTAAAIGGAVWILLAATMFAYEGLTARMPDLPGPVIDVIAGLLRTTSMDVAVDGHELVLFSMRTKHPVAATVSLFADPMSVCLFVAGSMWIVLAGANRIRAALGLALVMIGWSFFRAIALLAIYMHFVLRTKYDAPLDHAGLFWNEWVQLAFVLPASLVASCVIGLRSRPREEDATAAPVAWSRTAGAAALVGMAAVALTMGVFFKPSGPRKAGRILIDEYHCKVDDWTRARWAQKEFDTTSTLRPFDTGWYGEASGYNYASLFEYCSRFYTMARNARKPLDARALQLCDVLVLKVPSRYYADEEIAAVRDFVDAGGGLMLIGEHTTVFGSSVPLNQIARAYGFEFRYDCLFGMDDVFEQEYSPSFVPHPVVARMGPLDFAVSCSIDPGSSRGCAVIRDNGLKSLDADYHVPNFYPQPEDRPDMLHGSFVQLWSTSSGTGRVLAFTDSTIFANFGFYEPGKSELFLGMLEWLNHREGPSLWWVLLLGLGLAGGALVVTRAASGPMVVMFGAAVLGWFSGAGVIRMLHDSAMPRLEPQRPVVRVAFERSLCTTTKLPTGGFIAGTADDFGLFERAIQRLTKCHESDYPGETWTSRRARGKECFDAEIAVFVHPSEPPPPEFARELSEFVAGGGRLLVLDSAANTSSTANALLGSLDIEVDRSACVRGSTSKFGDFPALRVKDALEIRGGKPLVRVGERTVGVWKKHGGGVAVVLGFGSRFADLNMGVSPDVQPDAEARAAHEFEYALLRAMAALHGGYDAWLEAK